MNYEYPIRPLVAWMKCGFGQWKSLQERSRQQQHEIQREENIILNLLYYSIKHAAHADKQRSVFQQLLIQHSTVLKLSTAKVSLILMLQTES